MAVKLIANYSKRLGLPGYSSHQFSVSVETELNTTDDVSEASQRLYQSLQANVDAQIQNTGFVPPGDYGMEPAYPNGNEMASPPPGNVLPIAQNSSWQCSPKQQELILKLIAENDLQQSDIEQIAQRRFGKSIARLNKLEATGLIDTIIQDYQKERKGRQGGNQGGGQGGNNWGGKWKGSQR